MIRTADFFTTEPGEHQNEMSIPISFPLFIKPLTGGDSRGVDANSIVYDIFKFSSKGITPLTAQAQFTFFSRNVFIWKRVQCQHPSRSL